MFLVKLWREKSVDENMKQTHYWSFSYSYKELYINNWRFPSTLEGRFEMTKATFRRCSSK